MLLLPILTHPWHRSAAHDMHRRGCVALGAERSPWRVRSLWPSPDDRVSCRLHVPVCAAEMLARTDSRTRRSWRAERLMHQMRLRRVARRHTDLVLSMANLVDSSATHRAPAASERCLGWTGWISWRLLASCSCITTARSQHRCPYWSQHRFRNSYGRTAEDEIAYCGLEVPRHRHARPLASCDVLSWRGTEDERVGCGVDRERISDFSAHLALGWRSGIPTTQARDGRHRMTGRSQSASDVSFALISAVGL